MKEINEAKMFKRFSENKPKIAKPTLGWVSEDTLCGPDGSD